MIIPVRCFTCGKVIAPMYEEYRTRVAAGQDKEKILDDLGLTRYCCRRMIISHADLIKEISQFD